MISKGQNDDSAENPMPVTIISIAAASSRALSVHLEPQAPTASVAIADPKSVAVAIAPTSALPSPSAIR